MENLPDVVSPPPPPTAEDIFETPNTATQPVEAPDAPSAPVPDAPKPKRKYQRDPQEMKAHMDKMRAIAAANRERRKREKEKENVPPPVTSHTALATQAEHGASFEKFMEYYTAAEQYKAELQRQRQIEEDAASFRADSRKENRRRKRDINQNPTHPFGIQPTSNQFAHLF